MGRGRLREKSPVVMIAQNTLTGKKGGFTSAMNKTCSGGNLILGPSCQQEKKKNKAGEVGKKCDYIIRVGHPRSPSECGERGVALPDSLKGFRDTTPNG